MMTITEFKPASNIHSKTLSLVDPFTGKEREFPETMWTSGSGNATNPWYNHHSRNYYGDACHANWWSKFKDGSFTTFFVPSYDNGGHQDFWWQNVLKQIPIKYPWLIGHLFLFVDKESNAYAMYIDVDDWKHFDKHSLMNFLVFQRRPNDYPKDYMSYIRRMVEKEGVPFRKAVLFNANKWMFSTKDREATVSVSTMQGSQGPGSGHFWFTVGSWRWVLDTPADPFVGKNGQIGAHYIGIDRTMWYKGFESLDKVFNDLLFKIKTQKKYEFISIRKKAASVAKRIKVSDLLEAVDEVLKQAEKMNG